MDSIVNVIEITDAALEKVLDLRAAESIPGLALGLRVVGVGASGFTYETAFIREDAVNLDDHIEEHRGLSVVIPPSSIDQLRGSILDLTETASLVIRNPNPITPGLMTEGEELELEGTVEERITQLLETHVNPAIASHGGHVKLIAVDGATAHLEMGGGCQGCGLAAMTLREGIETAIKHNIPEIEEVVDATDHMAGTNPYY